MRDSPEAVIRGLLARIETELGQAQNIAKAAVLLAESGNTNAAVKLAMDIEDPAAIANRMLSAILLIRK